MKKFNIMAGLALGLFSLTAVAAHTVEVKMMTQGSDKQALVFEPIYTKINVGDSVTFEPMQKAGHTSISVFEPAGAQPWRATPDTPITVKLTKEGVYLVECDAHKSMGMVAVIQVGRPLNLEEATKKAAEESAKMVVGKDRFSKALSMVK